MGPGGLPGLGASSSHPPTSSGGCIGLLMTQCLAAGWKIRQPQTEGSVGVGGGEAEDLYGVK